MHTLPSAKRSDLRRRNARHYRRATAQSTAAIGAMDAHARRQGHRAGSPVQDVWRVLGEAANFILDAAGADFAQKWMSAVATECKRTKHHPEWTNVYSRTHIRWTTHSPPGLSGKDVAMARFCDEAAAETEVAATATQVEEDKTMMQTMRMGADECCTRKQ